MAKFHIKREDQVIVLAGSDKGRSGKVLKVLVDKERVLVDGINLVSKSTKPKSGQPTRIRIRREGKTVTRIAKKSGEVIK